MESKTSGILPRSGSVPFLGIGFDSDETFPRSTTPTSLRMPSIVYSGKHSSFLKSRSHYSLLSKESTCISTPSLQCKRMALQSRDRYRPQHSNVTLATIYPAEKTLIRRELIPPPHSLDLSYGLHPVEYKEGLRPTLPIHKEKSCKVKGKPFCRSLELEGKQASLVGKNIQMKKSESIVISRNCPRYRIPVEYNIFRNVRKYAIRRVPLVAEN